MSKEEGIELLHLQEKAIDKEDFEYYLKELVKINKHKNLAIFMDNLKVHTSLDTKEVYKDLDIMPIFNAAYSPELNPIEAVFSKVKFNYNRERLNCLVNETFFDPYE